MVLTGKRIMDFREMTAEDAAFVAEHSISRGVFAKQEARTEWSYTLEDNGKVLGVGGIIMLTPTTAWAWLDITEYAMTRIKTCYRVISDWMMVLAKSKGIRRLQAYIDPSFPQAVRLAEHLNFHRESTMKNFLGDKDADMYVRGVI